MIVAINIVFILLTIALGYIIGKKIVVKENKWIKLTASTFSKVEVAALVGILIAQIALAIGALFV